MAMHFKWLRYFQVAAEVLNFREAAARLGISQPTLSQAIAELEEELQVSLFFRRRQKVELTLAGQTLRRDSEKLFRHLDRAMALTRAAAKGIYGFLRVGFVSSMVTAGVLPSLIRCFRGISPEYELTLRGLSTEEQLVRLAEGSLDVGFVRLPLRNIPELFVEPVHFEPLVLMMPRDHSLAGRDFLPLSALDGESFIFNDRNRATGYYDFLVKILNDAEISFSVAQEAGGMYTLSSLVSSGMGVALAPASVRSYKFDNIVIKDMPQLPGVGCAVVMRRDEEREYVRAFFAMAMQRRHKSWNSREGAAS